MSDFLNEYDGVTLDTHKKEPVIYTEFIKKFKKWLNKIATTNNWYLDNFTCDKTDVTWYFNINNNKIWRLYFVYTLPNTIDINDSNAGGDNVVIFRHYHYASEKSKHGQNHYCSLNSLEKTIHDYIDNYNPDEN